MWLRGYNGFIEDFLNNLCCTPIACITSAKGAKLKEDGKIEGNASDNRRDGF